MSTHRADRFVWEEGDITWSQCLDCRHKHTTGTTCTAFPASIPEVILTNSFEDDLFWRRSIKRTRITGNLSRILARSERSEAH
jgi:hypothetical protein